MHLRAGSDKQYENPLVMLILAFPIFGIIMYLLVGLNGHTYKMRQRYDAVDAIVLPMLDRDGGRPCEVLHGGTAG